MDVERLINPYWRSSYWFLGEESFSLGMQPIGKRNEGGGWGVERQQSHVMNPQNQILETPIRVWI